MALVILVAGIGGGLVWLVHVSLTSGLQAAANWAQLASVILAVITVAPVVAAVVAWWRRTGSSPATAPTADQVDHAHRTLRSLALGQWREEILLRQLDDPAPLAVRWRLTELPVMGPREHAISANSLRVLLTRGRHRLTARSDRVGEFADEFYRLSRRRLVILGDPGTGKTTLVVLLVRELLRQYEPDLPVPLLVSMSDWRPAEEPLRDWLARRLVETYPAMRAPDFGPDVAGALVAQGRVLPVLDGLDELPAHVRPGALAALNAELTADEALILTCRTTEYQAAITAPGGAVLVGGAVIEPDALRPGDVNAYLRGCLRERPGGGWADLMYALADRGSPVARALTTPLDLWLLRTIYIDTGANPRELLDTGHFPTAAAITDHLLDHLIPAAISARPPERAVGRPRPARPHYDWDPDDAQRWLSDLADHLHTIGSHDIAWWRLHRMIGIRPAHRLAGGVLMGLAFGTVTGLVGALGGALSHQALAGLCGGLVAGLAGGLVAAFTIGLTAARPAFMDLRLRGRLRALARTVGAKVALSAPVGLAGAVGAKVALNAPVGLAAGWLRSASWPVVLAAGLVAWSLGGLVVGLLEWSTTPLPDDLAQTPVSTLRRDLRLMLGRTISALALGGFLLGLVTDLVGWSVIVLALAGEGTTAVLLRYRTVRWLGSASSIYLCTLAYLRLRRRAPRRMMRFLDDAHRIGLLRRMGPVYQFRHAKLQDRLAQTHRRVSESSR